MKINHKIKVLLISPSPPPVGGIQTWTKNLLEYYKGQDHIELVHINTTVKYRGQLELGLWKRIIAGIRVTNDVLKALRNINRINPPDVIHLASSASLALFKDYLILKEAKKFNIPVILHWHFGRIGDLAIKKNWEWRLIKNIIQKSAYSIVIDDHSYKALIEKGFKNVVNIPNPISPHLQDLVHEREFSSNERIIGRVVFVGHVLQKKGVFELVEACKSIHEIRELIIAGPYENEFKDLLINLSRQREDGHWLRFLGSIDNKEVINLFASAHLMALPSYTEGFPIAVLEAMAMGCPVLATNVGAISKMLDIESNNPCGICVNPKNIEELTSALFSLISDSENAKRMGENGIKKVLSKYTFSGVSQLYEKVWINAISESRVG